MSQRSQSDGGQKGFAVGRGLLAAAETLNFSMNEQRSGRQAGGVTSGVGSGGDGQDGGSQMPSRRGDGHLGSTMKLFASLGLSPSDLDALAQLPEEDISVDTLPQILMQLKSRKGDLGERRAAGAASASDKSYRSGREGWDDVGRMGGAPLGQASSSSDFGYGSMQDGPSYGLNYGGSGGGRDRSYTNLSRSDSYEGLDMGTSSSDRFVQRRMGPPSQGKVQDFLGVVPAMFPHVCSLCDFDVHSTMEWKQHTNGLRHAENRRQLLNMYPDWDPGMGSGRSRGLLDSSNMSAGLLGPAPMSLSLGQGSVGMGSWGGGPGKNQSGQNNLRSRVVVVKYARKPLSNKTLFAFTEPFGRLREHLVLKNKAFLEMGTHEEALDVVNYYQQQPASLYGKPIFFYVSQRLLVIEKDEHSSDNMRPMERPPRDVKDHNSQVVFFSNLPREEEKKRELLTIAGRFGTVEKHLFLTDQAFVQLGTPEDAEMLVRYYTVNQLTIRGRPIRLNICTKYKTLNLSVKGRQGGSAGDMRNRRATPASSAPIASPRASSRVSRPKEEEKKAQPNAEEDEEKEEEEEEEVSGVMEAEDGGDGEESDGDTEGCLEPEAARSQESVKEEMAPDDSTATASADVGGAEAEAQGQVEPEEATEPVETKSKGEEPKEEEAVEPGRSGEGEPQHTEDQGFLENMEDFVTLDELAEDENESQVDSRSIDNSRKGGMRVVNIMNFRRGLNFLHELLALAKPFGKVVKHLVLDLRPEAYIQFEKEEEARAMSKFYNSNVTASVCGRPVRVSHSMTYPTIQCGSSRVVYIGQLPITKHTDDFVLNLARPFGKIKRYFVNRIKRECFMEMERVEDAEKMAEDCKVNPPKMNGKRLTIYVSRKYRQLKHGHVCPPASEEVSSPKASKTSEEPPAKKPRVEQELEHEKAEEVEEKEEEEQEKKAEEGKEETLEEQQESEVKEEEKQEEKTDEEKQTSETAMDQGSSSTQQEKTDDSEETEATSSQNGQSNETLPDQKDKPGTASLPLPPFDPNNPIGTEHVKRGYYCRVCFLFYSKAETAMRMHCSSQAHYDSLQKFLEKHQNKAEANQKTTA